MASSSSRHELTVSIAMSLVLPEDGRAHTRRPARLALSAPSIPALMGGNLVALISVPFFPGAIGYVTNWTGIWMLFEPGGARAHGALDRRQHPQPQQVDLQEAGVGAR